MRRTLLVVALVALTGCSSSNPSPAPATQPSAAPSPTDSGSTSASPSPVGVPLASLDPGVLKSVGQFAFTHQNGPSDGGRAIHVTLSVGSVLSTATGTRLTFWLNSSDADQVQQLLTTKYPELYPTLTDPRTKKTYRVTTWRSANGTYCVCSNGSWFSRTSIKPMDAAYSTLPDDVSEVIVAMPGETGSVTVPVTR